MNKACSNTLLDFLPRGEVPVDILLIHQTAWAVAILQRLPKAKIYLVEPDEEKTACWENCLQVDVIAMDFHREALPFSAGMFDYIIAEFVFDEMQNPQDFAFAMFFWLKEYGHLLASLKNIRHWRILQELMEGHFRTDGCHFFARPEMEQLFETTFFKETEILPVLDTAPAEMSQRLRQAGFLNLEQDFDTVCWLVKASRSTKETAFLKRQFSAEIREEMAIFLRRIAYDIERAENCRRYWALCRKEGISAEYTAAFVANMAAEPFLLIVQLIVWAATHGVFSDGQALLEAAMGCMDVSGDDFSSFQRQMEACLQSDHAGK